MAYQVEIIRPKRTSVPIENSRGRMSDAELEMLKAQYQSKIAQLEQERVALNERLAELDLTPIAKEATLVDARDRILSAIGTMDVTPISTPQIQALFK